MKRPFRSKEWRSNAKGQDCQGRFDGCRNDTSTVVLAHIRRPGDGMGTKPPDWRGAYLCAHCHELQERHRVPAWHVFDAMTRTLEIQLQTGAKALGEFYG